jgi:hypothetical protein
VAAELRPAPTGVGVTVDSDGVPNVAWNGLSWADRYELTVTDTASGDIVGMYCTTTPSKVLTDLKHGTFDVRVFASAVGSDQHLILSDRSGPVRFDLVAENMSEVLLPYTGAEWTASYRGVLLGGESAAILDEVGGLLQTPDIQSDDLDLLQRDGLAPGRDYLGGRTVTLSMTVMGYENIAEVSAAFSSTRDESPLRFRFPGVCDGQAAEVWCRVRKSDVKLDELYARGAAKVTVELFATDPRMYGPTKVREISPPSYSPDGFAWPITFPFAWPAEDENEGATELPAAESVGGRVETWPTFEIKGAVTRPVLRYGDGELAYTGPAIGTSEILTLDSARRAVVLGSESRYTDLDRSSRWFALEPGSSASVSVHADAWGSTAVCRVRWRDAWI